ncbi:heterokaryon incompatibility protein-domain-containing protein [Immersiella caudata]|uniref:Heterokaryon incompatibility protein-domain-containing protein n=1 Tax=Immersiella caudata TaxID=314043 RepID=A0AA39WJU1_9PEZI|nr:heterokaryon incompatibility protein-domain-containing protein [Immersiella caudata]
MSLEISTLSRGSNHSSAVHKSLKDDEIRLAHFFRSGDQLHCELKHVSTSEQPEYHALSYVWGWTSHTDSAASGGMKKIFVNGKRALVTANLANFIDTITQLQSPAPMIWADAVCINQHDVAEKNAQVRRMGDIYKGASHIDIWLGKHDESSRTCIENLNKWHKLVVPFTERYLPNVEELYSASQAWLYEVGVLGRDGYLVDREAWMEFSRFVEMRKYWRRVWTVQEYCMPGADIERTFLCGDTTFTHQCLRDAIFLAKLIMHSDAKDVDFLSRPMGLVMATGNLKMNTSSRHPRYHRCTNGSLLPALTGLRSASTRFWHR